jgi:hypothetical protein
MTYSSAEPEDCAICLDPLKNSDYEGLLCGHEFHLVCLQETVNQSQPITDPSKCPLCRQMTVTLHPKRKNHTQITEQSQEYFGLNLGPPSGWGTTLPIPSGWLRHYCPPNDEGPEEGRSWIQYDPREKPGMIFVPDNGLLISQGLCEPPRGYHNSIWNGYHVFLRDDIPARRFYPR